MSLDYQTLEHQRHNHPAWRLLCSDHAPLIASFLYKNFILPNSRTIMQSDLAEKLEDQLYQIKESGGDIPRSAAEYLDDWASREKGWLRKFYIDQSDEPHYDLTPSTEKAIVWLQSLTERTFVGTGSRLMLLLDMLREIHDGSVEDPEIRIEELQKRRDEIDSEINRIKSGELPMMDDTMLRERFLQFMQLSRELLSDFREVDHNFRELDRQTRERITKSEGSKGELVEEILGSRNTIDESDQGRSFQGFWDFLMSSQRQEQFSILIDRVLDLPAIKALKVDPRIRRIHYDWLQAGEHTQRTVARLSQQLRRFLDDQARMESRRILEIVRNIEGHLLAIRENPPSREFISVPSASADMELPFERPLYRPRVAPLIEQSDFTNDDGDINTDVLFNQIVIDKEALTRSIIDELKEQKQITLQELSIKYPLQHGLAEIITYMQLNDLEFQMEIDEDKSDTIYWESTNAAGESCIREAILPRVTYIKR